MKNSTHWTCDEYGAWHKYISPFTLVVWMAPTGSPPFVSWRAAIEFSNIILDLSQDKDRHTEKQAKDDVVQALQTLIACVKIRNKS